MARGYLNSLSFPAGDVDGGLELLSDLRAGMAQLLGDKVIVPPVMCAIRAAQMPITPDYVTLPHVARTAGARFRDTVLFFLTVLDQRSPVHAALSPEDQEEALPSVVDGADCPHDPEASTVLVSCALDDGILLSLGSSERWRAPGVDVVMLTANADAERRVRLCNVHDGPTAVTAVESRRESRAAHRFENWDHLTGDALRAPQLDAWFVECRTRPGLEQVVMRSLSMARDQGWRADGDLVKKLSGGSSTLFEIRAWYGGSNNVRVLFGRVGDGSIAFGFGGTKTSPDWYDHAMPQAERFLSEI